MRLTSWKGDAQVATGCSSASDLVVHILVRTIACTDYVCIYPGQVKTTTIHDTVAAADEGAR